MTWSNPPSAVTELRAMLLSCSSFTGAGFASGSVHYPQAVAEYSGTSTDLPSCVLSEDSHSRARYAEGAIGLPSGSVSATLTMDTDAGTLEALARAIAADLLLVAQSSGLPISDATAGLASDPDTGERAADVTETAAKSRSITITATYGLRA